MPVDNILIQYVGINSVLWCCLPILIFPSLRGQCLSTHQRITKALITYMLDDADGNDIRMAENFSKVEAHFILFADWDKVKMRNWCLCSGEGVER